MLPHRQATRQKSEFVWANPPKLSCSVGLCLRGVNIVKNGTLFLLLCFNSRVFGRDKQVLVLCVGSAVYDVIGVNLVSLSVLALVRNVM